MLDMLFHGAPVQVRPARDLLKGPELVVLHPMGVSLE
jgi:hypothetical protein